LSAIVIGEDAPVLVFPEEEVTVNPVISDPLAVNATDTVAVLA
jgi:hypothetical protein